MKNTLQTLRLAFLTAALISAAAFPIRAEEPLVPVLDGPWWQVASNPDLGAYTRKEQQPVDFAVWQAADGTWQLWSCIRKTGCGGVTRLFHRWEGKNLFDKDWRPMGIAMESKPELGERPGGLQAPHVVRHDGLYYMAYGDWDDICFATSKDGKNFERIVQADGKTGVFTEGPGANTRDAMLVKIGGLWHCYYTAFPHGKGYGFCRTSPDLKTWSESCVVSYGGKVGPGKCHNECPHVVEAAPGEFLYFRNQYYGEKALNWVYNSRNPLNFGIDEDSKLVLRWKLAAPEIIRHEGKYYIAALLDSLQGIRIAPLKFVRPANRGKPVFDFDSAAARESWKLKDGNLPAVFTKSKRSDFQPPMEHFIATAETDGNQFDDDRTGVIESPPFTLEKNGYFLYVSGGNERDKLFVALVDADTGQELARLTGKGTNAFEKVEFDSAKNRGKKVFLRIVDRAAGPWGHVNFGGMFADPLREAGD
jgi:hypothetical protein